jgi:hypothetical protein
MKVITSQIYDFNFGKWYYNDFIQSITWQGAPQWSASMDWAQFIEELVGQLP